MLTKEESPVSHLEARIVLRKHRVGPMADFAYSLVSFSLPECQTGGILRYGNAC